VSKVWISNVDGTKAQAFSTTGGDDSPVFSPDGSQIAFVSTRQGGDRQIFIMDADGQNMLQVTRNSGSKSMPSFAPAGGGQLIAYTAGGILFKTDISTGDTDRLLPPSPKDDKGGQQSDTDSSQSENQMTVTQFAWAPGAKKREEQALAATLDSNNSQMLAIIPSPDKDAIISRTNEQGQSFPLAVASNVTLGWSADGGLLGVAIMGTPNLVEGGRSTILLFNSSGEPMQKVVIPPAYFEQLGGKSLKGPEHPLFSPDGEQVVYELWDQPDLASRHCVGLYKVPVAGDTPPQAIVQGDAEKAQFTPDGQSLLYLSKRADGGHDLCEVGTDGSNPHRLSDGKQDVTDFSISPQRG
jgi:Tol biopolymer transport system component